MLGLCCQWLDDSGKNILPSRRLQLGRFNKGLYSPEHIKQVYVDNLQCLLKTLPVIYSSGIRVFRMSSAMFSLFDKVPKEYYSNDTTHDLMKKIGKFVLDNNMRLTTHPGQFVVLSSPTESTVTNSIREINFHGWLFDKMGLPRTPYYSINIHGGGKPDVSRAWQLLQSIKALDPAARERITLENCEFGWSVKDLIPLGVPITFDSHHHRFNTGGLDGKAAMKKALSTWPEGIKPLTHLSNSPEGLPATAASTKLRAHSDFIREIPDYQREANNNGLIDIDVEAKKKNLAIFDMVEKLGTKL